ncbi:MAG: ACT domain-containing protein [Lachnospira sp.]
MTVKQISVFLENKPGKLAGVTATFADSNINVRALSLAEAEDFGIVRLITNDVYNTSTILKDSGFIFSVKDVLAIEIEDKPGSLTSVLELLGKNSINLEYMYAFSAHTAGKVDFILSVADNKKACDIVTANGIKILSQDDLS